MTDDEDEPGAMTGDAGLNRARLADFAATSGSWFWETDADLRFTYFSPNVLDITGVPAEWHYGKTREDYGMPDAMPTHQWEEHLETLRQRQPFSDFVFQRQGPDGRKWMRTTGRPIFDSDGVFQGYRGTGTDITVEVNALRTAERLAMAIENLDQLFALWDGDDRLVMCNRRYREMNEGVNDIIRPGISFVEYLHAALEAGVYPQAKGREDEWLRKRLAAREEPGEPIEVLRHSGHWFLAREQRLPGGYIAGFGTNITELKRIETELAGTLERESEALRTVSVTEAMQRSTLAVIADGVVMQDTEGRIVLSNPAASEILGLTVDQMMGRTSMDPQWSAIRSDGSDFPGEEHPAMVTLRTGQPQRDVIMGVLKPDGTETWISINSEPVLKQEGAAPTAAVTTFKDITEHRRREAQLTAQAEKLRKFAYLASHDLREPLRKIAVFADFLEDDLQEPAVGNPHDTIERIRSAARRGNTLVENVLKFATLANETLNREWTSLPELIDEAMAEYRSEPVTLNVDLTVKSLRADRNLLKICLSNLIDNSVKYASTERPPHIIISSIIDPRTQIHELVVSDNGIGFDPVFKDRIFEPFTRLVAKHDYEGSGIGLSFVKDIVATHGWQVGVDSEPGVGTVFRFRIPNRDVELSDKRDNPSADFDH